MAMPRGRAQWEDLATEALAAFISERGAVVWLEVEANLCEPGWINKNFDPTLPPNTAIDPHHLTTARRRLANQNLIATETKTLSGSQVTALLDNEARQSRRKTEVEREAAQKRRLYRSYLSWTSDSRLCGDVAEAVLYASIRSVAGEYLVIPPGSRPGQARRVAGQDIRVGGPLDAAGSWVIDPETHSGGLLPFGIEVKNVRSVIYPWDHEVWDLIAKLAAIPDAVPILVARRCHLTTFRCFKDIGALAVATRKHWFSDKIDSETFERARRRFGFYDARQTDPSGSPDNGLVKFFSRTAYTTDSEGKSLMIGQAEKWRQAAPIVGRYAELRDEGLPPKRRQQLWRAFSEDIVNAGLYTRGQWAPEDDEEEDDEAV